MPRLKLVTLIAAPLIIVAGALAYAHQGGGHHGGPAGHMEAHLDQMRGMLAKIGATEAQQTQIDGILRGAFTELKAATDGHHAAMGQFHQLLLSPSIDREKLESIRADQIKALDAASKRLATAFGDAAEILTVEQRQALAAEVRKLHGE